MELCDNVKTDLGKPEVVEAFQGHGPRLQRDSWVVIRGCRLGATEVAAMVGERLWEFPPDSLVGFRRLSGRGCPLVVGEDLEVRILLPNFTPPDLEAACLSNRDYAD